jgi:formylmethanofuran dehydrogenase subunit B
MALQQVGEVTCPLGEVRSRADLVIFWGSDPARTHPRHMERYSADPVGRFVPGGRAGRFVVEVDDRETESAKLADLFIEVPAGRNWDALWTLRMLVRGIEGERGTGGEGEMAEGDRGGQGGKKTICSFSLSPPAPLSPSSALADLAQRMKSCRCGIVFFGGGVTRERLAHRTIEALLQLVTDLNEHTRFCARRMRRYGDVAGADSVLAWQTGYPFGVNLARGFPRYNPGEFTGPEMLARGEVDVCVIVGGETAADLPNAALARLRHIPVILLDPPGQLPVTPPAVRFTTAVYGVHRPGTAYRMDEVPVPLRVILPTDYPSDGEVLGELLRRIS